MAPKKLTKEERKQRETDLADTMFYAFASPVEEHAKAWAKRATALMEGLSKTAVDRARRQAMKQAADFPPGFVLTMEAVGVFDELVLKYGISKRDEDIMWGAAARFNMFCLSAKKGDFYEAARDFKLTTPELKIETLPAAQKINCNCPNCRVRTDAEWN